MSIGIRLSCGRDSCCRIGGDDTLRGEVVTCRPCPKPSARAPLDALDSSERVRLIPVFLRVKVAVPMPTTPDVSVFGDSTAGKRMDVGGRLGVRRAELGLVGRATEGPATGECESFPAAGVESGKAAPVVCMNKPVPVPKKKASPGWGEALGVNTVWVNMPVRLAEGGWSKLLRRVYM